MITMSSLDRQNDKWTEIAQLSESYLLPKLPSCFYFDDDSSSDFKANEKYFLATKSQSQKLAGILTLLKSAESVTSRTFISSISTERRQQLASILALIGEHYQDPPLGTGHGKSHAKPWSSEQSSKIVLEIIIEIKRVFSLKNERHGQGDLSELFVQDFNTGIQPSKSIFGQLLQQFRSKLVGNENWKHFPAAQCSFCWILFQVQYPYLSDFIPGTLQPVLNFYDDFQIESRLDALECIGHIVDNVNKADLCAGGMGSWCAVLYKSLMRLLQITADGIIVGTLIPQVLKILRLLEKDPHEHCGQFTMYDEVLECILHTIEFGISPSCENYNEAKIVWLQQLNTCLEIMGFATLHWINRIIRIFNDNVTSNVPSRWLVILQGINTCIANTWLKPESEAFSEIVLKILYNLSVFEVIECTEELRQEILQCCDESFKLLRSNSDWENVKQQLKEVQRNKNDFQPKFNEIWNNLSLDIIS